MTDNSDAIQPKRIKPVKEAKRYEVEVYIAYHEGVAEPFTISGIVGATYQAHPPLGDLVERYVFEVERPKVKSKKLKGQV